MPGRYRRIEERGTAHSPWCRCHSLGPVTTIYDLAVVGAGPAGRSLAHRALAAGLRVAVVDPEPDAAWSATYGVYTADLPDWFDDGAVAARAESITVFTPTERVIPHGYAIMNAPAFQRTLGLDGADVRACLAVAVSATTVTCSDGRQVQAGHVVDARGTRAGDHRRRPRQTAAGAFEPSDDVSTVLMDWRRTSNASPGDARSFSYRVALGDGRRLVEETCLAGAPPIDVDELAERNRARTGRTSPGEGLDEVVDFPLLVDTTPWRRVDDGPVMFGAAGGLMNPATGYSVGQSLLAADVVVGAIVAGHDPHEALWPRRARLAYRLRVRGLAVLLSLDSDEVVTFFDAFFRVHPSLQRRYLSGHSDASGVLRAMAAVFARLPIRLRARVMVLASRSAW